MSMISGIGSWSSYTAGQASRPGMPPTDLNTSGVIGNKNQSTTEFTSYFDQFIQQTDQGITTDELFSTIDSDQDGVISQDELETAIDSGIMTSSVSKSAENVPGEELETILDAIDTSGDDKIDQAELLSALQDTSSSISEEQVNDLMEVMDSNQDGYIDISELEENRPTPPPPPAYSNPQFGMSSQGNYFNMMG